MFDVLVYNANTAQNAVYRNGIPKSDAKKLVKELRKKGFKAQFVTSKGKAEIEISLERTEPEED